MSSLSVVGRGLLGDSLSGLTTSGVETSGWDSFCTASSLISLGSEGVSGFLGSELLTGGDRGGLAATTGAEAVASELLALASYGLACGFTAGQTGGGAAAGAVAAAAAAGAAAAAAFCGHAGADCCL